MMMIHLDTLKQLGNEVQVISEKITFACAKKDVSSIDIKIWGGDLAVIGGLLERLSRDVEVSNAISECIDSLEEPDGTNEYYEGGNG